jgi:DNA-binding NarL/FixJ family response regulator
LTGYFALSGQRVRAIGVLSLLEKKEGSVFGEEKCKVRILLFDDQQMVRQGMRNLLDQEADFIVVGETENGREVFQQVRELKPDLIIIEARMARVNTVDIIRKLKMENPDLPVLVVTAFEEEKYVIELLKAGAGGYLFKNAAASELAQAIRFVRAGHFVSAPSIEKKLLQHTAYSLPVEVDFGERLTRREVEVLKLVAKGMNNNNIASYLGLTEGTVKNYLTHIFNKMGVTSRMEAVTEGVRRKWLSLEEEP